jgi:glycerol uptake facilitator-like aquaporin
MPTDWFRRAFAEFVGTFALVFIAVGSVLFSGGQLIGPAIAQGFVIAVMASAVGHISGGHFNPAVTFGFAITRRMEPVIATIYIVTQLFASVVAALALRAVFPNEADLGGGVPQVNSAVNLGSAVLVEGILTFFLVWVVFAHRSRSGRRVQVDRGARDRPHDHVRHPRRRPADRRGDEPGARVRPGARRGPVVGLVGLTGSGR